MPCLHDGVENSALRLEVLTRVGTGFPGQHKAGLKEALHMTALPEAASRVDTFARRLLNGGSQIESRCIRCGAVIIGSAMHGLREDEDDHREQCPIVRQRPQGTPN